MNKRIKVFIRSYGNALNITGAISRMPKTNYEHTVKRACETSRKASRMLSGNFWKTLDDYKKES